MPCDPIYKGIVDFEDLENRVDKRAKYIKAMLASWTAKQTLCGWRDLSQETRLLGNLG